MREEKKVPFIKQIFKAGMPVNLGSAFLVFFFSVFFMNMHLYQFPWALLVVSIIIFVAEFAVSPIVNNLLTVRLSKDLEAWEAGKYNSAEERTELFERLMRYPFIKGIETFLFFVVCAVILCLSYRWVPKIAVSWKVAWQSLFACLFGSYCAFLMSMAYSERISIKFAERIVAQGVDAQVVAKKRHFGITLTIRTILFLILPAFETNALFMIILGQSYEELNGEILSHGEQILRMCVLALINVGLCILLTVLYYRQIRLTNSKLRHTITRMLSTHDMNVSAPTSIADSMQYNVFTLNQAVARFNELLSRAASIGDSVKKTTDNLSVIAKELSSTSLEQSADVKEILTTMEDTNAFSQNIAGRIEKVSYGTDSTKDDVSAGFDVLRQNIQQMEAISESNKIITEGIRSLGQQIDSIGDVVTLINDVADQTRIIAFNAELEAVSAGDEGRNFHIVATEIRRLANSTMNSVHEIQKYIETIQTASKNLIGSSESGTRYIQEETRTSKDLEKHFTAIQKSAEETSVKAAEITSIISQQTSSFNQIVITLRQISAGIESFTVSTKSISDTASQMQDAATRLSNLQNEGSDGNVFGGAKPE